MTAENAGTARPYDPNRPDFERPLFEIEDRIAILERSAPAVDPSSGVPGGRAVDDRGERGAGTAAAAAAADQQAELARLRAEHLDRLREIYAGLTPWQIVSKVARHPKRPQSTDYLRLICKDFCQLHGDRRFGDDPAILTGFARIGPDKVMVVAHRKGRDTNERMLCNFGCAHPEGYRKALKNMKLAEKFGAPVVTFVDTPGAYPGIGAEERGQAEAIAVNLREMSRLKTPVVSVIIGEGGSGGALGIAVADRVAMLRFSWYSVISPEGCAAILWKRAAADTNEAAATALHLTAEENLRLGVIDEIIEEPPGGAHRDHAAAAESIERWITANLRELKRFKVENLVRRRYERLRSIGVCGEVESSATPATE